MHAGAFGRESGTRPRRDGVVSRSSKLCSEIPDPLAAFRGTDDPFLVHRDDARSRSFQLINQAIDSNENSESEMQSNQRNKHQDSDRGAHGPCYQQRNNRARETGEGRSHANSNL